jgi:hypothetical protein
MSAADRSDRLVAIVGAALLALYIAQAELGLQVPQLAALQHDERYKVISGSLLAGYLLYQSLMARRRLYDPVGVVFWHKLAGALAPLLLYLHASRFAYGYLLLLSSLYLTTVGLGLLHRIALRRRALFTWWLIIHLATACSLVVLSGYHAIIALAYE